MQIDMDIDGLDELDRKLMGLSNLTIRKTLEQSLMSAALPIMKNAKIRANVSEKSHWLRNNRTGRKHLVEPGTLKNSIKRQRLKKASKPTVCVRVGKKNRNAVYPYYWHFVERGTSDTPAYPFLRPAFEANWRQSVEIFKAQLAKRIDKLTQTPQP